MTRRDPATTHRRYVLAVALAVGLSVCLSTFASDDGVERAQLAAILRQLDMLERTARHSALSAQNGTRYRFDYARLHADLTRIRAGIEEYLSPTRAQPRDPHSMLGDYRREQDTAP